MNSSDRAFTLIEVMVALTLLGLVAMLAASGTRLAFDISGRGSKRVESMRVEKSGNDTIRRLLEGALPFQYWTLTDGKRVERIGFDGTSDRVRFVSREGVQDGPGSVPRWIEIRKEKDQDAERLVLEERRALSPDNQPAETPTVRVEALRCAEPRFDYLELPAGEKPRWHPQWNPSEVAIPLPSAVRIHCKTAEGLKRLMAELDYAESARQGMRVQ